jgi:hypothetical protein
MKVLGYIVAGLLSFCGILVLAFLPGTPKYAVVPAGPIIMGLVFLVWSSLLVLYLSRSYRGGAGSIVGAVLLGIGIWSVVVNVLGAGYVDTEKAWMETIGALLSILAGVALLVQGHKIHKSHAAQE